MAEAALRAEAALWDGRASSEDSDTGARGRISSGKDLLRGKQMIMNESVKRTVRFNDWLRQKKAANTRLTLTIEVIFKQRGSFCDVRHVRRTHPG